MVSAACVDYTAVMRQDFEARFSPNLALVLLWCTISAPAAAADISPWDNDIRSAVRLIGAGAVREPRGAAALRAGVEIKMQPGWKTYWRYPGDSGVPPAFDFEASDNVKTVTVLWPAPVRFADGSGNSIGYKEPVIFPLRVVPRDASKPVTLRLKIDYAVCETLCVPAKGKAELALSRAAGSQEAALDAAEARVPKPHPMGEGTSLKLLKAWRDTASAKPRVLVEVAAPAGAEIDLFAEGPTPDWALPLPEPVPGAPAGAKRFAFELDGLPSGATAKGAAIKLTATARGAIQEAVEAVFRLD
jgi:DsbC/DsbD-like thiol-disulfide interchange protein